MWPEDYTFLKYPHMRKKRVRSLVYPLKMILNLLHPTVMMNSFKLNYSLTPNIITTGIRISTHEFWSTQTLLQSFKKQDLVLE